MLEYLTAYLIVGFRVLALIGVNVAWALLLLWVAGVIL
jgi:hypothetical protein